MGLTKENALAFLFGLLVVGCCSHVLGCLLLLFKLIVFCFCVVFVFGLLQDLLFAHLSFWWKVCD